MSLILCQRSLLFSGEDLRYLFVLQGYKEGEHILNQRETELVCRGPQSFIYLIYPICISGVIFDTLKY